MEHECSVIALAGTPKAGKTTIFNGLTGMCRYTGSWWGDRGTSGRGTYTYCGQTYMLLDMPGAYSLPPAPFPDSGSRETGTPSWVPNSRTSSRWWLMPPGWNLDFTC